MRDKLLEVSRFSKKFLCFKQIINILSKQLLIINAVLILYNFEVSRKFIKFIGSAVIIIECNSNMKDYLANIIYVLKIINGCLIKVLLIILILKHIIYKIHCIKEKPFKLRYDLEVYVFKCVFIGICYIIISSIVSVKDFNVNILPIIFFGSYILEMKKKIYFYLYSLIYLLIIVVIILISLELKNKLMGEEDRSYYTEDLEIEIYRYLEEKNQMGFMVYGEWGVGKTYKVKKCIDKYLRYRNKKYYYISCFGLTSRNAVLNELKNIYSKQDNSIRKKIAECMRIVPIVGELLYSWFQPEYEFKDMKKGSTFIFDDFERISILLDIPRGIQEEGNINSLNSREREILQYDRYNKFNIVTGIINELICIYDMKVIIICNKGELGEYNKIFNEKLQCKMFNIKNNNKDIFYKFAEEYIKVNISISKEKHEFLSDFFKMNNNDIYELWNETKIENLRFYNGIIIAFIDLINILNGESFNKYKKYAKSIFFTVFWGHIYYYTREEYKHEEEIYKWSYEDDRKFYLNNLNGIINGQDIYIYKYKKLNSIHTKLFEFTINKDNIFWMGNKIAYSWIKGKTLSENCIISELEKAINYTGYIEECLKPCKSNSEIIELSEDIDLEEFILVISILSMKKNIRLENAEIESILKKLIEYDKKKYIDKCNIIYKMKDKNYDNIDGLSKKILELLDIFNKYGIFTNMYNYNLNKDDIFRMLKETYPNVGKFSDMDVDGAYRARRINPLVAEFENFQK